MKALIDCRADNSLLSALENYCFEPITMPPADYLQAGVASHTDMLIFIGFGRLFCHASYYDGNKELIDLIALAAELDLTVSTEQTGKKYPSDVLFNACLLGNKLICNTKTVSKLILNAAKAVGCEIINVPQGYTKCSICVVSDTAIITADKAIARVCRVAGIEVLTVSEGHILLPPYNFGFIGGASGLCGDKVYFCGSINRHPDGAKIKEFCEKHGKTAISLSDRELTDVGSLFFI